MFDTCVSIYSVIFLTVSLHRDVLSIRGNQTSLIVSGKSKEAEMKRINKELANIRNKFKGKFFCIYQ